MAPNADLLKTNAPVSMQRKYWHQQIDPRQLIADRSHASAPVQYMQLMDLSVFRMFVQCTRTICKIRIVQYQLKLAI